MVLKDNILITVDEQVVARQTPEAQGLLRTFMALVAQLLETLREMRITLAELRGTIKSQKLEIERLKQPKKTPRNSSIPPSTQHPHAKPKSDRTPSGTKRGGQLGHPKHARELIPVEACDQVVELRPETCRKCGAPLDQHACDLDPLRHQVWDIPPIQPIVIEYRQQRLLCEKCHVTTCAPLPQDVGSSQAEPKVVATVAVFLSRFRGSRRLVAEAIDSLFHIPASASWIVKLQDQATELLRPIYDELLAALPAQLVVNADETPYKQGSLKTWLWTVASKNITVFALRLTRKDDEIQSLLGIDFKGTVICDRAKMSLGLSSIQWCWAHLRRDFIELRDMATSLWELGQELIDLTDELFSDWHRYREKTLTWEGLQWQISRLKTRVIAALTRGLTSEHSPASGRCRSVLSRPEALWQFASEVGVEPTNNAGERSLRMLVLMRRLTYGTQSETGSRFVETVQPSSLCFLLSLFYMVPSPR